MYFDKDKIIGANKNLLILFLVFQVIFLFELKHRVMIIL